METTKKALGRRVRDARRNAGFRSADDLAERLEISATSVYELERGDNWISPEMLEKLCSVLRVQPRTFFEDSAPPSPTVSDLTKIIARQEQEISDLRERLQEGPKVSVAAPPKQISAEESMITEINGLLKKCTLGALDRVEVLVKKVLAHQEKREAQRNSSLPPRRSKPGV